MSVRALSPSGCTPQSAYLILIRSEYSGNLRACEKVTGYSHAELCEILQKYASGLLDRGSVRLFCSCG